MYRWLIEYDRIASVTHFLETAAKCGVHISGIYPQALALVAEGTEDQLQKWVATITVRNVKVDAFVDEAINKESNPDRKGLMKYWNGYLLSAPAPARLNEGLSWDHPGFLPPDLPEPPDTK